MPNFRRVSCDTGVDRSCRLEQRAVRVYNPEGALAVRLRRDQHNCPQCKLLLKPAAAKITVFNTVTPTSSTRRVAITEVEEIGNANSDRRDRGSNRNSNTSAMLIPGAAKGGVAEATIQNFGETTPTYRDRPRSVSCVEEVDRSSISK